jgi:hypothetical protein
MVGALTCGIVILAGAGARGIGVALRNVVAAGEALLKGVDRFERTTGSETDEDKTQWQ